MSGPATLEGHLAELIDKVLDLLARRILLFLREETAVGVETVREIDCAV